MSSERSYPVIDEITGEPASDPDGEIITELVGHDYLGLRDVLSIEERAAGERAWRFGHVIVDEAQDLTPMQWRMIARRARGHSMTIVGDLAQRVESHVTRWAEVLPPELGEVSRFDLTTNYRAPAEVAAVSNRVLEQVAPELSPPTTIRSSDSPVRRIPCSDVAYELPAIVAAERELAEGRIAVIGIGLDASLADGRVSVLSPRSAKGLEFDSVIVVQPSAILAEPGGPSLLYVAVSRSTSRLTIAYTGQLPDYLRE